MRVVGADVWSKAWVAVVVDGGLIVTVSTYRTLGEVAADHPEAAIIGVDIPIGLPVDTIRQADILARQFVGPRSSSVFSAPPRDVLLAGTYQEALAASRSRHGRGLSAQSYALRDKILEAELVAADDERLREIHPEMSFRALKGEPLAWAKKTWNGQMERRRLLADAGLDVPDDLHRAGAVAPDDVLDACAVAWSAYRVAGGEAESIPEPPEVIDGQRIAIWF